MEPSAIGQPFRAKFRLAGDINPLVHRRTKPNGIQDSGEHPNASTSLLHNWTHNDAGAPLIDDSRRWVRWPSNTLYLTYKTLGSNYVNVFLVFVPLGIISGICKWDQTTVFILNFLAIIPLASLLSFATEELSAKLGQTLGGLLNATFGNAVELIVFPIASLVLWLLTKLEGQRCRASGRRNPNSSVKHAWIHPFEYIAGSWVLLPGRRPQI